MVPQLPAPSRITTARLQHGSCPHPPAFSGHPAKTHCCKNVIGRVFSAAGQAKAVHSCSSFLPCTYCSSKTYL